MNLKHKSEADEQMPKLPDSLQAFGWTTLKEFTVLFTKLWTPVQLLLAAAGLTLAIYYGNALRLSLINTHRSVALALTSKLEPTRNTHQGITALLLSSVKEDWAKPERLNVAELTSILQQVDAKVRDEAARSRAAAEKAAAADASRTAPPSVADLIGKLNLAIINPPELPERWRTAVVSMRRESFIMVPSVSFRRKTLNEASLVNGDQSQLTEALKHNPEIMFDLHLASELEPLMRGMDKASGERLTIKQTYFITESGVFLIRASGVKDQGDYYKDQFESYTQFMDRPYFWRAIDVQPGQVKPTPFDYGTKPYLDLGGNGFVVTFSKKIELPNQRVGVLCVDAKLPEYVTDEIKEYVKSLGASISDFYWIENEGREHIPLPPQFSWFNDQLNESREARSRLLGNIAIEPQKTLPSQSRDVSEGVVRFTVPVVSGEYGDGIKRTRLLGVEFDSAKVVATLYKNLAIFIAGICLVIAVAWSLFWDYTVLKKEMSNVLEKITKVMRDASTPFVWLDEKNEFVEVNQSMLNVLGHKNINELRKQSRTFKGLLTAATQPRYEEILNISGAGQETGEYEVDVITKSGKVLHVRAHGERIPYPTWLRRGLPHRFGIFVEVTEAMPAADPS